VSKTLPHRLCAVCLKMIPAGTGAFRRGLSFVHVECANKAKEAASAARWRKTTKPR
jgi:predicted nucleic acid-binding Zn ribbon protein